ncbi:MAG TPA: HlyD family efflux transporter periplasmic adaptor subunit [Gammaproteobacteria bacterium]|nr:HlyD family efflux transporter periplasmic adaptor subunit [Gammaproteobacteria bacterium]
MDIQRPATNKRRNRRIAGIGAAVLALVALTVLAVSLARRPPGVDGDALWSARVTQGEFVHEVSANGTLVAPEIRAITNRSDGVVERIVVLPGHVVEPDDVLVELSSPQIQNDLEDVGFELEAAEAEERLRQAQGEDKLLDMRASMASAEAEYTSARLESDAKAALGDDASALEIEQARIRAEQLLERLEAERAKLARQPETRAAEDAAAEAKLAQQRQKVMRLQRQADDLFVRAGMSGVVQEINVEAGERASAGTDIARIVNPRLLIARVRVSERDEPRVEIGQPVRLEIGRETLEGRVSRIDPTVRDRLVTLDVELVGEPKTALRPDTSVTARIELDRVPDTLLLDRPVQLRDEDETVALFRRIDGDRAERVTVAVGRASPRQIEIVDGLEPGDDVILADMSEWVDEPLVRIR